MKKGNKLCLYLMALTTFFSGINLQRSVLADDLTVEKFYFERTENSRADFNDVVLTLEEKGIRPLSEEVEQLISNISFIKDENLNTSWADLLDVQNSYVEAFTSPMVTTKIGEHANMSLYDADNDDIYWDDLVDVVYKNNLQAIEDDKKYQNELSLLYNGYESLDLDEIKAIILQLQAYTKDVKCTYPKFDMKNLACQLSELRLLYKTSIESYEYGTLATTNSGIIRWFLNEDSQYPIIETSKILNDHEFKHLISNYCSCEYSLDGDYFASNTGIHSYNNNRYDLSFIEEALAEEYACSKNNVSENSYYENTIILDNIRYVLSLQDDYQADGFLKYSFLRNPIAVVQQFPVLDKQKFLFDDNIEMLAAYDTFFKKFDYSFIDKVESTDGYEQFLSNDSQYIDVYSSIGNYAQNELSRLFFTNLIVLNEQKDMTIAYNLYLLRLFEKIMYDGYSALAYNRNFTYDITAYQNTFYLRLDQLFDYLSEKFNISKNNIYALYNDYSLNEDVTYPKFVTPELQQFYHELNNRHFDALGHTIASLSENEHKMVYRDHH